jgi:uncharacterized cupredoxin-like copper-binding protein
MRLFLITGLVMMFLLAFTVFTLSAQDASTTPQAEPHEIDIEMHEHDFQIAGADRQTPLELVVGQPYELHFHNSGTLSHEVLFGSQPIQIGENMMHDFTNNMLEDVEVEISGMMNDQEFAIGAPGVIELELNPGQTLNLAFTLSEDKIGAWEMGCFTWLLDTSNDENPGPSHYDVGMHLALNVVAGS